MEQTKLECDARDVMEQIQMAESRHMQMGALVSYQLQYPDMTIRDISRHRQRRTPTRSLLLLGFPD